jgi:hypothetical protein
MRGIVAPVIQQCDAVQLAPVPPVETNLARGRGGSPEPPKRLRSIAPIKRFAETACVNHSTRGTSFRMKVDATVRCTNRGHAVVAAFVSAAFLWTIALAASPRIHAKIHRDANSGAHTCAVTLIASGSCNHAAPIPLVSSPTPATQFATIATLTPKWVKSPFLGACIFEHAPPVRH